MIPATPSACDCVAIQAGDVVGFRPRVFVQEGRWAVASDFDERRRERMRQSHREDRGRERELFDAVRREDWRRAYAVEGHVYDVYRG